MILNSGDFAISIKGIFNLIQLLYLGLLFLLNFSALIIRSVCISYIRKMWTSLSFFQDFFFYYLHKFWILFWVWVKSFDLIYSSFINCFSIGMNLYFYKFWKFRLFDLFMSSINTSKSDNFISKSSRIPNATLLHKLFSSDYCWLLILATAS